MKRKYYFRIEFGKIIIEDKLIGKEIENIVLEFIMNNFDKIERELRKLLNKLVVNVLYLDFHIERYNFKDFIKKAKLYENERFDCVFFAECIVKKDLSSIVLKLETLNIYSENGDLIYYGYVVYRDGNDIKTKYELEMRIDEETKKKIMIELV